MFAVIPIADIDWSLSHVRFVPKRTTDAKGVFLRCKTVTAACVASNRD